ncbi:MAG: dihydrofolate reductase family protein [Candidatus Neomarinimicrobiota bacterium]
MKITYYAAASIDGYIARSDGSIDWLDPFHQSNQDYGYAAFYDSVDALVMGRTTYEQIRGFGDWPYSGKPALVLTSRLLIGEHIAIKFVTTVDQLVAELNQSGYNHIWLVGGGKTAAAFLRAGLIDELTVSYIPVALGTGIPLFAEQAAEMEMEIIASEVYPDGVVQITYRIKS